MSGMTVSGDSCRHHSGLPYASPLCTECGIPILVRIHAPGTVLPKRPKIIDNGGSC